MFYFYDLHLAITAFLTKGTLLGYLKHRYGCVGTDGINGGALEIGGARSTPLPPTIYPRPIPIF